MQSRKGQRIFSCYLCGTDAPCHGAWLAASIGTFYNLES